MKKNLRDLDLENLHSLYTIVSEMCSDYSKMTDNYSLATGDNKFENMPQDIANMINDRQRFFSYKLKIKDALIDKIIKEMENYE